MGVTVTVQDETRPGAVAGTLTLEDVPAAITLRDLIRTRVREEVARVNAAPGQEVRTLVEPVDAERTLNGYRVRYLCIVAGRGSGPRNLYLPFEEDSRLSVVLSKALLLADDERIDDPAITRQISRQIARHG